jgi:hypothetical protein
MVKVRNAMGDEYSGKAANAAVFAKWKGIQYRRKYVIPTNPKTIPQKNRRNIFTAAVTFWHTLNAIQRAVFGYLASGMALSGFNLLVRRWCVTPYPAEAYPTPPVFGMILIGSDEQTKSGQALTVDDDWHSMADPLVEIDSLDYTKGAGAYEPKIAVCIESGAIFAMDDVTGAITISYESAGTEYEDEVVVTNMTQGDVAHTKHYPLTVIQGNMHAVKVAAAAVDSLWLNATEGKELSPIVGTPGVAGTLAYKAIADAGHAAAPLEGVKIELDFTGTNKVALRGYTDSNGMAMLGATEEDGPYDISISMSGYTTQTASGQDAATAVIDRGIKLVAV